MSDWSGGTSFYRVSVKALIRNQRGDILMVSEGGSGLSLPGGGIDHGETAHECLVRELHEEIALTTPFREKLISMQTRFLETKQAWLMWLVYEIDYDELDFDVGKHADEVAWVALDNLDISGSAELLIREALRRVT